jgi:type III secretion protein J
MRGRLCSVVVACLLAAGCETTVASGLDEAQANRVVVALDAEGIGAGKARESGTADEPTFSVTVPDDDVARALAVMRAADLPRSRDPGLAEVFGEASLVPTATEERARYVAALGGELARTLEAIDGVMDARVHVALPSERDVVLDEARPAPRASVLIRYAGASAPYDESEVKALVAGAVHDLAPADVAVIGVPAVVEPVEAASTLVRVGPIAVTRGSAPALKAVLGAALGLLVIMAALLVMVMLRRRRSVVVPEAAGET